jgi:2-deoxy-D-gluconate 3-dehydrogenase
VLINNAGVAWGEPLEQFPEIGWDKVMDTNVKGPFFLIQRYFQSSRSRRGHERPSHIVNVGSIDGIKTPRFENFSYGPSEGGDSPSDARTRRPPDQAQHHRQRHRPGAPSPPTCSARAWAAAERSTTTDWDAVGKGNPRGRVGTPEDIAGLAIFLSSRACGFTVGDIITCDGGSVVS